MNDSVLEEQVMEGLNGNEEDSNPWVAPLDDGRGPDEKEKVKTNSILDSRPFNEVSSEAKMGGLLYTESTDMVLYYLKKIGAWDGTARTSVLFNRISPIRFFNFVKNNPDEVIDMQFLNGLSISEAFEGRCVVRMAPGAYYVHLVNEDGYKHQRNVFIGDEWNTARILSFYTSFVMKVVKYDTAENLEPVDRRALDDIILPEEILGGMLKDINDFVHARDIYEKELRIPWKRGYMLIGVPGTGKTKLLRGLIKYWGFEYRDISKLINKSGEVDLSDITSSGVRKYVDQRVFPTKVKPSVCVMEDIDKFVVGQAGHALRESDSGAVPLHLLLKALDGVDGIGGIILMATTNYPDQMTEALLGRPGRFDRVFRIEVPSEQAIEQFITSRNLVLKDAPVSHISNALNGYNMAFVEELVKSAKMTYRRNEVTYAELSVILDRIRDHKNISEKYLGKKSNKVGFDV